ncbi:hypothetical protein FQN53_006969 [Emmonsiellopsis sp. PD_33]|nr:hypothetical protein FQN53_006969 [Emmonsiellopsis sp. PD_33]
MASPEPPYQCGICKRCRPNHSGPSFRRALSALHISHTRPCEAEYPAPARKVLGDNIRERPLTPPLLVPTPSIKPAWLPPYRPVVIQQTKVQSASLLFTKLPPEIRQVIFKFALWGSDGDDVAVHLNPWGCRRPCIQCPSSSSAKHWTHRERCWRRRTHTVDGIEYGIWGGFELEKARRNGPLVRVALLMTCRWIYTETRPLLYTTPTFNIGHLTTLKTYINTHQFPHIHTTLRHLELTVLFEGYPGDPSYVAPDTSPPWEEQWALLGGMKGLRTLRVHAERTPWKGHPMFPGEEGFLGPMMGVDWCEVFEVTASWGVVEGGKGEEMLRKAPFRFEKCEKLLFVFEYD